MKKGCGMIDKASVGLSISNFSPSPSPLRDEGPPKLADADLCRPQEAIERLAGCLDLYAETVAAFLREIDDFLSRLDAARNAHDDKTVHRLAHTLKGFAGMCGAVSVAKTCGELERSAFVTDPAESDSLFERLREELAGTRRVLRPYAGSLP
jgi:HPt (histidine-containing phosphotransfer) domain-containing protein